MTVRTLVIGIPLPHVTFDNYSFASAPSLSEYTRLIVEMESVSRVVEEVARGSLDHSTFAGQPVANAATTARAFGLADLLAMRRREAEQFFKRRGTALCVAHPDVAHDGIAGLEHWRRYEWLPEPAAFRYETDLLPGFGKGSVVVTDPADPFAAYVAAYGKHMAYRAYASRQPEGAPALRVFAESSAGVPVGFELSLLGGRLVFVPPLDAPREDRSAIAGTLFECFERYEAERTDQSPDGIHKEAS